MDWKALANRILDGGEPITREEALAVLKSSDDELLDVLQAAYLIRKNFFGNKVYYRANDGVHAFEPWSSDGTAAG